MSAAKIRCRTPAQGRKPSRIDPWRFVRIRNLILALLADHPDGVRAEDLTDLLRQQMGEDELAGFGSLPFYADAVEGELEVRGEIRRLAGPEAVLVPG